MSDKISRRDVLKGLGLAAAATAVAACQPKTVVVEKEVEKLVTQVIEVEKEVTKIVAGTPVVEKVVETQVVEVVKEVTVAPEDMPEIYMWPSISLLRPEGSDPVKYTAVQNHIAEQTGVRAISSVPPSGAARNEKLNLLLSSKNNRMDIFTANWPDYKDILMPLNDLLDQYGQNILNALPYPEINWSGMKDTEGNIWGIPRLGLMGHTAYTWFRTDWLEEVGMDMPSTFEELEAAFTAFREAHPDALIGSRSISNTKRCLLGGFTEYGFSNWFDKGEGVLKPPELQPGFADFLAKMNEWWDKGWWHPEAFTSFDMEEFLKSDRLGIWAAWYSRMTIDGTRVIVEGAVPGMAFGFPDVLKGPEGDCRTNNASMTSAYVIPQKCPVPDAVIKFMDWQYDPIIDNVVTCHAGIQGTDWEWVDPNNKYYVRRLAQAMEGDPIYAGEFYLGAGLGPETWYAFEDPLWGPHYEHIHNYAFAYDNAKMPVDVDVPYDMAIIRDKVPGLADIDRLRSEEQIKFVMGRRPLTEFDDFIAQLYDAGLDDWIAAYSEQYLIKHPS